MKLVGQGLSCTYKLFILPNQIRLPVRTFSNFSRAENKHTGQYTLLSFYNKGDKLQKIRNISSHVTCINGCQRVHCKPIADHFRKMANSSLQYHTNRFPMPLWASIAAYSSTATKSVTFPEASKSHSGLQVKRPLRKKLPSESDQRKALQADTVVAYAVAEELDLLALEKHLTKQGLYFIGQLPQDVTNTLHVRGKYNIEQKPKEIFVFEDGSVVFWSVPELERSSFLRILGKVSHAPYSLSLTLYEKEEIDFISTIDNTCLSDDLIHLRENDKDSQQRLLEMYAYSNALAQSVKLAMWETSFNKFVTSIENVTEDLRMGRKISMSRRQVLMKTGELFSIRHFINLSSDLLDTPDFYWDRESLEPLYVSLCNYLSISRRTKVMNQKLNHCCELTELLSSHLNDAHHTRLEVMIIILIMVEVVFEIVHAVERYWHKPSTESLAHTAEGEVNKEAPTILMH